MHAVLNAQLGETKISSRRKMIKMKVAWRSA